MLCKNVVRCRDFIKQIFLRDLLASYRKSFLGYAWIAIAPIAGVFSWVIMHGAGILQPGDVGVPYPVYLLTGTLMWGFFAACLNASAGTLSSAQGFLQQVSYPHEVMLVKQLAQEGVNFTINLGINLIVIFLLGVTPAYEIIFLPLVLLPMVLFAAALGLWISMIAVIAPDITKAVTVCLGFMIYLIPVVYGKEVQNQYLALLLRWNPLSYLVCSARDLILYGHLYGARGYALASIGSVFLFLFSLKCFYRFENRLIERMV